MRDNPGVDVLLPLLEGARYEVLPTAAAEDQVLEHVPPRLTVTVTASPRRGLRPTLDLTERLARHGYDVVPHLAARMVSGRGELTDICSRLVPLGVRTVFVPAGDADPPAGDYASALDLLEDLTELGSPFADVGITGYPHSHPTIHDDLTVQSMWDKSRHATHIVSNMSFDPAVIRAWVCRIRARGVTLPVLVGLAGAVGRTKLLAMASKVGIGESTRFLSKHKAAVARLAAPGGFNGERFLRNLAPTLADPEAGVTGLHVFTFNQLAETEAWRRELVERWSARP